MHLRGLLRKRDFYAGALMILIGLFVAAKGQTYRMGTLVRMGPGFMPTVLGIILLLLGIAIAMSANSVKGEDDNLLPPQPQWLAWACILASPLCFIVFGAIGGMIPAAFTCVFVAALGDRTGTLKSAFVLAIGVTVFGVAIFHYILQVPMPVLAWRLRL